MKNHPMYPLVNMLLCELAKTFNAAVNPRHPNYKAAAAVFYSLYIIVKKNSDAIKTVIEQDKLEIFEAYMEMFSDFAEHLVSHRSDYLESHNSDCDHTTT